MSHETFRMAPSLARALEGAPIHVGSENRAKLGAVREALQAFAASGAGERVAELSIVPVAVDSGVPEQPIGWDQIVAGARNRARAALATGAGVLGIGVEDGLVPLGSGGGESPEGAGAEPDPGLVYNVGCAWVTDGEREGHGFSSGFAYPPGCLEPAIRDAAPIGDLFDRLWRAHRPGEAAPGRPEGPSGRQGGNIGKLTGGRLDRSAYGAQAIVCALVRFLHTDLYD